MPQLAVLVIAFVFLSGCVSGPNVRQLEGGFLSQSDRKVGVVVAPLPTLQLHKAGAQGLLDIAINEMMTSEVGKHLASIELEPYHDDLSEDFVEKLNARGANAKTVDIDTTSYPKFDGGKDYHPQDLRASKETLGVDYLLVVQPTQAGAIRSYYGFVPTSEPKGYYNGIASMVDLETNKLVWNQVFTKEFEVAGEWDEPPNFTNLTRSVDSAIEWSKTAIINDFFVNQN